MLVNDLVSTSRTRSETEMVLPTWQSAIEFGVPEICLESQLYEFCEKTFKPLSHFRDLDSSEVFNIAVKTDEKVILIDDVSWCRPEYWAWLQESRTNPFEQDIAILGVTIPHFLYSSREPRHYQASRKFRDVIWDGIRADEWLWFQRVNPKKVHPDDFCNYYLFLVGIK